MVARLERVVLWLDWFLKWYIVILMALLVGLTFVQVAARYIMKSPFTSTEQYSRMVLVWLTFMGTAMAVRRNKLVRIEILEQCLPRKVRQFLSTCFDIILLFLLLVIIVKGWEAAMVTTSQVVAGTPLNYAWFVFSTVVGGMIMFFYVGFRRLTYLMRTPREG